MDEDGRGGTSIIFRLLLVILAVLIAWWAVTFWKAPRLEPDATPKAVTARGSLAEDEKNSVDIFKEASPAVVFITSVELRRNFFSLNVYEIPRGTGSGFVWDTDGKIVTNYHVIEDAGKVVVTLADGSDWKASLVGTAPDRDISVLKVDAPADKLRTIPIGESKNLLVGQKVFAIGNPFGLDQTMTTGIVSALGREITSVTGRTIHGVIQTDAAINPGNSGGPLLDSAGRLIGMNTAIYSPSGASAGIGFAVPVEVVNHVVTDIIKHGKVIRPGIGVTVANERIAARLGIEGVLIVNVTEGSAAERAGLKGTTRYGNDVIIGDVITSVNDVKVTSYNEMLDQFEKYKVGDTVTLKVMREGEEISVPVVLEEAE